MPLVRRLPKRGFNNKRFAQTYQIVNLKTLEEKFSAGDLVDERKLRERGIIKGKLPIKILGEGELTKSLIVQADAFSQTAKEKILSQGGKAELRKSKALISPG
jgi:large subunit ribosomal protein L15